MNHLKIRKLNKGDYIGIFSSSSPTNLEALEKMKKYFTKKGYKIKTTPNILEDFGYMAGTAKQRASDFNMLINDDEVKLIITANGGKSALQLLPLIDYDTIRIKSKGIVGLSDPSILLNAITAKTGLITIHGPNGYSFGHSEISKYSEDNWWKIVSESVEIPYEFPINRDARVIKYGETVSGQLYGGHLSTIRNLIKTEWEPDWDGCILFIEEVFSEFSTIDTMLTYLDYSGVLSKIAGLVIGKLEQCEEKNYKLKESFEDIVLRNCKSYNFPIIIDVLLGHTDDKLTLPIGAKVRFNSKDRKIELLDNVVF